MCIRDSTKFGTLTQFDPLGHSISKIGPSSCTFWLVYALDVSFSFSETFAVQNDKTAYLNLAIIQQICKKKTGVFRHGSCAVSRTAGQCRHTVNGDGSKTAKIIKSIINHTNIDIQAMLVWLTLPFYDFCGFWYVAVNSMYKLQFFYIY